VKVERDLHSLLHYALTRAALEGKVGSSVIHVALPELTDAEGPVFTEDADEVMLKVTITTEWVDADDVGDIFESNLESDPEDQGDLS
jgi:hypothetical protein